MKIGFIYPDKGVYTGNKNWMYYLGKELEKTHEVFHNTCPKEVDLILGMSVAEIKIIAGVHATYDKTPLILYNWDMHPDLQSELGAWDDIGWDILMKNAREVWTQSHYHADLAEKLSGIRHYVIPMGALDFEMEGIKPEDKGYAMMASRRVPYKGFDFFERGCKEAGVPFKSRHPNFNDRKEYLEDLAGCKVLVVASEEEANTPMSGYEAAFLGKPLLLRDHPVLREEWEDSATYFTDLEDFKSKLTTIDPKMGEKARQRANRYKLGAFAERINNRLCELF